MDFNNKFLYVINLVNNNDRRIIHNYIQKNYKNIKTQSFCISLFEKTYLDPRVKCEDCGYLLYFKPCNCDDYCDCIKGICSRCKKNDLDYDYTMLLDTYEYGELFKINYEKNNCIVIGNYFEKYNIPDHAKDRDLTPSKEEFDKILKKRKIYIIKAPLKKNISNKILKHYIDFQLKNQQGINYEYNFDKSNKHYNEAYQIERDVRLQDIKNILLNFICYDVVEEVCNFII
jgi:hypothetical protein